MKHIYGFFGRWKVVAIIAIITWFLADGKDADNKANAKESNPAYSQNNIPIDLTLEEWSEKFSSKSNSRQQHDKLLEFYNQKGWTEDDIKKLWVETDNSDLQDHLMDSFMLLDGQIEPPKYEPKSESSQTPNYLSKEDLFQRYEEGTPLDEEDQYGARRTKDGKITYPPKGYEEWKKGESTSENFSDEIRRVRKSGSQEDRVTLGIILCVAAFIVIGLVKNAENISNSCMGCLVPIVIIVLIMIFTGAMSFDDVRAFFREIFQSAN